jgi:hypothetical protein
MIFRILRRAHDEENHQADGKSDPRISGRMLSLSKHAIALTPTPNPGDAFHVQ